MSLAEAREKLKTCGWVRLRARLQDKEISRLRDAVSTNLVGSRQTEFIDRNVPDDFQAELRDLGYAPHIERAVAFTKGKLRNWSLPWHQDRVIVSDKRTDDPDLSHWSKKKGVWHCEPTAERLSEMAFLYIALDSMGQHRGGLELAEGTHRFGKILAHQIPDRVSKAVIARTELEAGEALLVHALCLHRSGAIREGNLRRAIRFDLSALAKQLRILLEERP